MSKEKTENKLIYSKSTSLIEHKENLLKRLTNFFNKLFIKTNKKSCKTKEEIKDNGSTNIQNMKEEIKKEKQKSNFLDIDLINDNFNKDSHKNKCLNNNENLWQESNYEKEMDKKIDYFKANLKELKNLSSWELIELNNAYKLRIQNLEKKINNN